MDYKKIISLIELKLNNEILYSKDELKELIIELYTLKNNIVINNIQKKLYIEMKIKELKLDHKNKGNLYQIAENNYNSKSI
jgi:hypothetical protein